MDFPEMCALISIGTERFVHSKESCMVLRDKAVYRILTEKYFNQRTNFLIKLPAIAE